MASSQEKSYTEEDYYNLPEDARTELIDGQFYNMSSPGRVHQELLMELSATIFNYIKAKGGSCRVYPAPFAVKLFNDRTNIVEPDISVICDKNKLTDEGCNGAPDWVIEIVSPSSKRMDYYMKLFKYQTAGVREYWIVDPENKTVRVLLQTGKGTLWTHEVYKREDVAKVNVLEGCFIELSKVFSE